MLTSSRRVLSPSKITMHVGHPARRFSHIAVGLTIAAAGLALNGQARAATFMDTLKTVSSTYNLYSAGDVGSVSKAVTSDTEGKIAAGGSAYFQNYSIAEKAPGGVAIVVGKNLRFNGGSIKGSVVAGGSAAFPSGSSVSGTITTGGTLSPAPSTYGGVGVYTGLPVDFAATTGDLKAASAYLDSAAAQAQGVLGTEKSQYGTLTLSSAAKGGVVFFDVKASDFTGLNNLVLSVNKGVTAIVNVTGATSPISLSGGFSGGAGDATLFNFVDATALNFANMGFYGSILAPNAAFTGSGGQINGALMVGSFAGSTQLNEKAFDGKLPTAPVPEPATWAMMLVGFFGLGAGLRARRAALRPMASAAA